jgi:hypothetical protein
MRPASSSLVTQFPSNWAPCNPAMPKALITMVCGELRRIAKPHLRGERRQRTLRSAALIRQAYFRLFVSPASGQREQVTARACLPRAMNRDQASETGRVARG